MKQLLFLLFLIPLSVFSQQSTTALPFDSMTFSNASEGKQRTIFTGDRIRLFKHSGMKVNGDFISISEQGIRIEKNGVQVIHTLESIKAIRVFNGVFPRIAGGILATLGVAAYVVAGIVLPVGITLLGSEVFSLVIFYTAQGFLYNSLGNRIKGKKYKLDDGWMVY
ncbi:MAG: hypothetical protein P8O05_12815 [Flavobacteriales bacterium]|nr:hypothetical protein [Flavobacteriales bacterium]